MSLLRPGDEALHYSDCAHRWVCPDPELDQEMWTRRVREHVEQHGIQPERGYGPGRAGSGSIRRARVARR